ncbi:MAG: glycosyltransferase family 4 protein [Saprospiraceae bacterium]
MPEILPKNRRRLLMVSDTAMFAKGGQSYALGPVVREINSLLPLFYHVTWIGFNRPEYRDNASFSPVANTKIQLVFLKKCGGDRITDKLRVLSHTPAMMLRILREIRRHDVIYTRAPSSPAFIALILSIFFPKKIFWHKYAGNWRQHPAPRFFAFQRAVLKRATNSKVTINGRWERQAEHCLSFENPCLEQIDHAKGKQILSLKSYNDPLQFCFVGRLEEAKGVHWILEAFSTLSSNNRISSLHLVGDGPLRQQCEQLANSSSIPIHIHGFLSQTQVAEVLAQSHILLLPSVAEGFPKVVAEAANYGCIPVVTDVSCINQYIRHAENGFLLQANSLPHGHLAAMIAQLPEATLLKNMAMELNKICASFTYEHFVHRVATEILHE